MPLTVGTDEAVLVFRVYEFGFYVSLLRFLVLYKRPEEGFAMLELNGAKLIFDQIGLARDWQTAHFEPSFRQRRETIARAVGKKQDRIVFGSRGALISKN
jgi:hypothetical protein